MKRQTQVPGVRRWFGDDFLNLQEEPLTAIDALVGAYNKPCVISGCTVSNGTISKGFVALSVSGEGLKMMPFDSIVIATPCYLVAKKTPVNQVYADGIARLAAYQYKAVAQTQAPAAGVSFVKMEANGKCDRLPDVMQDALHRMVSDVEKTTWNAKETPTGAQTKATKAKDDAMAEASRLAAIEHDYTDTVKGATDTYIGQARVEARDYTDTRETAVREFVGVVETGLHRITESLTTTKADKTEVALKADKTEVALKANKTETFVALPQTGSIIPIPYYRQFSTWYTNTGDGDYRGRYLNLGDAEIDYQLRFIADRGNGPELHYRAGIKDGSIGMVEILHTGNTAQTVIAGKVIGSDYEDYIGGVCDSTPTGSKYKVTHNLGTDSYIVNITPINTSVRNFSVVTKSANYFEVQFDNTTPFEIQILSY